MKTKARTTLLQSCTLIFALCLAMCVLSSPVLGDNFGPTDDSYCKKAYPNDNFGADTVLQLRLTTSGQARVSFLKFTVSGISGAVTTANLKLYSNDQSGTVYANQVSDTSWTEGTITWNNMPSMGSTIDTQTMSSNSWCEFDVTSYITGDGTYSIGLETSVDARGELSSKEGADDPVLEVIGGGGGGDTIPPAVPTGLGATGGIGKITLDWNDNTEGDLAGYNAYRSTTSGSGYSKINGSLVSTSAYTDSSVSSGTTYYYVVRAVDTSLNESGNSNEDSAASSGGGAISPWAYIAQMDIGIDANWTKDAVDIASYTEQVTIDFKNKGFHHFRLRVKEETAANIYTFVDPAVDDALEHGVLPIIAYKSESFLQSPTETNQTNWVNWWTAVADHYKNYPYELAFDLIIEIDGSSSLSDAPIDQLNGAYDDVVTAIRNTGGNNASRIIMFSAPRRSDPYRMNELDIPTDGDGYLIGEFHEGYASGPSKEDESPHKWTTGTTAEKALITDRFDAAVDWRDSTNIPVWEGAWMPGNYNSGDDYTISEQQVFVTFFVSELKARDIPSAVNASDQFYNQTTNEWTSREPVIDTIMSTWYGTGGDTTPPANPTGLVTTGGDAQVSLDWDNNTEGDLDGYNVYRSTTSGSGFSKINGSLVSASAYTDSAVSNDTTYYYVVSAVDTSSNESGYSNEDSAMPEAAGPPPDIYVYDITMGGYESKTNYYCATATVWIKDDSLNNINGATVYGTWSGATKKGDEEKTTGTDGKAILTSSAVKGGGTFTFTVTDVSATGYNYNSSLNNEDYDSITVP